MGSYQVLMVFLVGLFHLGLQLDAADLTDLTGEEATETLLVEEALELFLERILGAADLTDLGADFARFCVLTIVWIGSVDLFYLLTIVKITQSLNRGFGVLGFWGSG